MAKVMLTAFKSVPLSILHKVGLELNTSHHFNATPQPGADALTSVPMVRLPVNCIKQPD